MECDKFDQHVMDALYGELDELTFEALKRHVEGCPRCGAVWSSLKSTRAAAVLPLEEAPAGLEARILAAEKTAHRRAPWHRKIMRAAAWAGSHAMRPQLAMAALFLFVIGSSLLLLRGRPGAPVQVSEQGRPERVAATGRAMEESKGEGAARAPAAPAAAKAIAGDRERAAANEAPAATAESLATAAPADAAASASAPAGAPPASQEFGTGSSPVDLLARGEQQKRTSGCEAAIPTLQGLIVSFPTAPESKIAEREIEDCKRKTPTQSGSGSATATANPSAPR